MKKNIPHLMIISSYFYPKIGGLENYAYNIAKRFHENKEYLVSVITTNYESGGYRKDIIDGITVHRLPIWFKISNTPINPMWYFWLKRIFKEERPDIINTHSPVPLLVDMAVFLSKKIPTVVTYHAGSMRKGKWLPDILIGLYEKIILGVLFGRADAVVAISQDFAKREFSQFKNKTYFIPTGVDLNRFKATPIPKETEIVTFIGRIEHSSSWKGIEQLLQAMVLVLKEQPNAKLFLVGGGDAVEHYKKRATELKISDSVNILGSKIDQDLVNMFQISRVIVLPSISDSEAFSVALVEAMASGRPVIGTNIGGTPQVIDDEKNGLLVAPKDPKALSLAILRVLSDYSLAERLGREGVIKSQGFDWEIQIAKYRELFKKLLVIQD
jgi:glycosyltransferase involved in cell wall biosynthesis